jgi:Cu-Zn family superoxide dismutase
MDKVFLILLILFFSSCGQQNDPIADQKPEVEAVASIYSLQLSGEQDPNSSYANYSILEKPIGSAYFAQVNGVVTVEIELFDQTPNGQQAVHIHNGTVSTPLRHWNQNSVYAFCNVKSMGSIWAKPFAGDIGNVPIDENGRGYLKVMTNLWALNSGDNKDILDKVLIVHQTYENFLDGCSSAHSHDISNPKIGGGKIELITDVERNAPPITSAFPDFTVCK